MPFEAKLKLIYVNHAGSSGLLASGILGEPGADSGGEGKSKQAEKYGAKEK